MWRSDFLALSRDKNLFAAVSAGLLIMTRINLAIVIPAAACVEGVMFL
jgi:hypothetical protein